MDRRSFLKLAAAGATVPVLGGVLGACGGGDDTPAAAGATAGSALKKVKIGFIALTDCAPVAMAKELGYFAARGIDASIEKQASWPTLRDALINGDIDAAHCLYSMPFAVSTMGGMPEHPLKVAMMLSRNGQGITLNAKDFAGVGYGDIEALKAQLEAKPEKIAMTYPGGTHDLWLRYVLKAAKYAPRPDQIIPIPPPQMVENMKAGTMSAYSVGEPWNAKGVTDDVGFTFLATQDIWQDHPEKALVVGKRLTEDTDTLAAVMGGVFEAARWLDDLDNRANAADTLQGEIYVNTPAANIVGRLTGKYELGADLGSKDFEGRQMQFFQDGTVNMPRRSHGIWALAQFQRFGYLDKAPDYMGLADSLMLHDVYAAVAKAEGIALPDDDMKPFTVQLDDTEFDPSDPTKEASRP